MRPAVEDPGSGTDVSQDAAALAELETLGVMTTLVTVIDGEVVIGFDRAKLERSLRNSKNLCEFRRSCSLR